MSASGKCLQLCNLPLPVDGLTPENKPLSSQRRVLIRESDQVEIPGRWRRVVPTGTGPVLRDYRWWHRAARCEAASPPASRVGSRWPGPEKKPACGILVADSRRQMV